MKNVSAAVLLTAAGLYFGSCAPREPYDRVAVERVRTRAELLIEAQSLMGYTSWVYGAPSAQDSLYRTAADLFSKENIALVKGAGAAEPDSLQRRRLWMLRRYLTTEFLGMRAARLTDSISNIEAAASVTVDGARVPFRRIAAMIANEPSGKRRALLYAAADSVISVLTGIHRSVIEGYRRDAAELGFASYTSMAEELKEFSLTGLAVEAESLLAATEADYRTLLGELVPQRLRMPVSDFRRCDVAALLRSREFDPYFTKDAMMEALASTWRGMGIDLDTLRTLQIDADDRATKNPRAACFAVDIPNDIRLTIKPIGGFQDYSALFHEMGHALHYALTTENAVEFRYMGEYSVTETYAFLSEYILVNQAWLRLKSGMPTSTLKDFVRSQAFVRLYMVRRYAAKVLYEIGLYGGHPQPDSLYEALQARAACTRPHPSDRLRYLVDIDPLFYSATYFRAWLLEGHLSGHLSRTFGMNWFETPRAGEFLRGLWAQGDRITAPDLARAAGAETITAAALLEQVRILIVLSTKPAAAQR